MKKHPSFTEVKHKYQTYSEIKQIIDEYFDLREGKKYEDFIKKLVMILKV